VSAVLEVRHYPPPTAEEALVARRFGWVHHAVWDRGVLVMFMEFRGRNVVEEHPSQNGPDSWTINGRPPGWWARQQSQGEGPR